MCAGYICYISTHIESRFVVVVVRKGSVVVNVKEVRVLLVRPLMRGVVVRLVKPNDVGGVVGKDAIVLVPGRGGAVDIEHRTESVKVVGGERVVVGREVHFVGGEAICGGGSACS